MSERNNEEKSPRPIGVGPHPKPWPKDERLDPELLANGDKRNVLDRYRYWTSNAIKADLAQKTHTLHIAIENWQHDFNIGTIVRSANAFNVEAIHIIGRKKWNQRGAMVTDKYVNIIYHNSIADFAASVKGRRLIAVDITAGATPLSQTVLQENTVLIFGGEGPGISNELLAEVDDLVFIEQFGSTRSINLGVAAGILMYAWMQQNVLEK